jgi:hypothetical protein
VKDNLPAERIEENRDFLRRLWRLENDDRPGFLISYMGPRVKGGKPVRSALYSTAGKDTVRDRLGSCERFLAAQLEEIEAQSACRGDYVHKILRAKKTNRGLFINVDITNGLIDESWPETDLDEIYTLLGAK